MSRCPELAVLWLWLCLGLTTPALAGQYDLGRPALPEEVANYPQRAMGRLDVKPGITGLWQVAGRANIGFDKMIDLDLAYVRSRSTLLNLILIMLTFRAVLSGRGAY